jgi:predicted dehydrogenase
VAQRFGMPRVYDHWWDLVEADDTNAIMIGTWPYTHSRMTVAALESGKHVLCEARMARNAREAYAMRDAAQANPHLVAQIVPAPMTLSLDRTVQALIKDGYLGDVLAIEHRDYSGFVDVDAPLSWRRHRHYSGKNIMGLGIVYETLMRWVGTATEVMALGQVNVKTRLNPETGEVEAVQIPDHLNVLATMACGAQLSMSFSQVTGLAGDNHMTLYGSEGTLRIQDGKLWGGERSDHALTEIPPHPEFADDGWRVEADFIDSIRGIKPVTLTNFDDGVRYMEFVEAVTLSMQSGEAVSLPL